LREKTAYDSDSHLPIQLLALYIFYVFFRCFFGSQADNIYLSDGAYLTVLLEACNFYAMSGIEVLLNNALITRNDDDDSIEMHDLLIEMGRAIVNEASPKDLGRRSRLWNFEDVCDVLKYNKVSGRLDYFYMKMHAHY
jgi:hypothetical protein